MASKWQPENLRQQKSAMERTVLVVCAVIYFVSLYFSFVAATQRYDTSIDNKVKDEEESKIPSVWFSPRLGRKKRNSFDLEEALEGFNDAEFAIELKNGRFICSNDKGKRSAYIPRLGRNVDNDLSSSNKWLQDGDNSNEYMIQRSPPFAPRLGKRYSPFSPRLGRDI